MSQYAQSFTTKTYSTAGTQFHSFERIVVSSAVHLPETDSDEESKRVTYKAEKVAVRRRFAVSLPWALLLIVLSVGIISGILFDKTQQGIALKNDLDHLQSLYTVSEQERQALVSKLNTAKDSNFICYYATQNLGMKLALHEETIRVIVPQTNPNQQYAGIPWNRASIKH